MYAQKDEYIQEASNTIYRLSQDENIRLQCEAREDYYRRQRSVQHYIEQQTEQLAEKDSRIANLDSKLKERNSLIAKKEADLRERDSLIAEKDADLRKRDSLIAEKDADLRERDSLIAQLQAEIQNMRRN